MGRNERICSDPPILTIPFKILKLICRRYSPFCLWLLCVSVNMLIP